MKRTMLSLLAVGLLLWVQADRKVAARDGNPAPTAETKALSPAGYKSQSQDVVIAPDGSINVIWIQGTAPVGQAVESVIDPVWNKVMPTNFLLDRTGKLRATLTGGKSLAEFEAAIVPLLE